MQRRVAENARGPVLATPRKKGPDGENRTHRANPSPKDRSGARPTPRRVPTESVRRGALLPSQFHRKHAAVSGIPEDKALCLGFEGCCAAKKNTEGLKNPRRLPQDAAFLHMPTAGYKHESFSTNGPRPFVEKAGKQTRRLTVSVRQSERQGSPPEVQTPLLGLRNVYRRAWSPGYFFTPWGARPTPESGIRLTPHTNICRTEFVI